MLFSSLCFDKLVRAHEFCLFRILKTTSEMWSNWFEDAKKKAEEALKQTSQIVSEVCFLSIVL